MSTDDDGSIIVLDRFVSATRDSGYKGTDSALSELVDNALEAGAKNVWISVEQTGAPPYPTVVSVLDDGCGMDRPLLRQAMRFGGTSRFNGRRGLGRYGMGLPNASVGQARRVEVFTWREDKPHYTYLDVDEIANGEMRLVPRPMQKSLPPLRLEPPPVGTLVVWTKCDRLSHSRVSTITKKVRRALGQVFRHYIWKGVTIWINGEKVEPVDPLFLRDVDADATASVFGEPIEYEVAMPTTNGDEPRVGTVTVTFTELPIHHLHALPNAEKRERGIANGAGVSIIRAGREIDYGWFFMGTKRRENYDDWWRAEVSFDPALDEAFGITHTKQQIRPQEFLTEILAGDMEGMAKALNGRVRQAHLRLKAGEATRAAEETARARERLLEPVPKKATAGATTEISTLLRQHPSLRAASPVGDLEYRIVEAKMKESAFFTFAITNGRFVMVLNPAHPFYRHVYRPLLESDTPEGRAARTQIELLLLSSARAEAGAANTAARRSLAEHRVRWSDTLATYLNR